MGPSRLSKWLRKVSPGRTVGGAWILIVVLVTTLRDIQLKIAEEELFWTDDGVEIEQEHSPGSFISMGLELEQVQ
jgi:hypothetical protein